MELDCVTHVCVCGSTIWQPDWVMFDDYEISAYSLNMTCCLCGATAFCPTEVDRPEEEY